MALPRSHPDQEPEGKQDGALVSMSKAGGEGVGLPASHLLLPSKSSPLLILLVLLPFQELKTENFFPSLIPDSLSIAIGSSRENSHPFFFHLYSRKTMVAYLAAIPPFSVPCLDFPVRRHDFSSLSP